ncbi:MAG: hypothetical protein PUA56_05395 [Bacillales bacterium]|nr:hypothetical protein [Bacillales bacterium]
MSKKRLVLMGILLFSLVGCGELSSSNNETISSSLNGSDSNNTSTISEEQSSTNNYVSANEVLKSLKRGPYCENIVTQENVGLENTAMVGVDQNKLINEERYAVPNDAKVYIAEEYNIVFDGENNSGNLSILINSLKNVAGNKVIKFKKGTYRFTNFISAEEVSDLYLVGEEGTYFEYIGWGTYFEAKVCKNIHINNIIFDMKYSPTISGTIIAIDESSDPVITLSIPEEFDLTYSMYESWDAKTGSYMECFYDESTGKYVPDRNKNLFYNSPSSAEYKGIAGVTYRNSSRELNIKLKTSFPYCKYRTPVIGTKVSFAYTMYENAGFHYVECENVYLENVTAHVVGGMGFRAEGGKNVYLNRANFMTRDGSERIMTCTADIIHTMAVEGEVNVSNCILEGSHDDALNIKSFYTKILSVNQSLKEITVAQTQSEINITYAVGDVIDIYNPSTMEYVASYTINELQRNGTGYIFTVDKRPNRDIAGYNCGNATKATHMKLVNSIIRNKRNRGILLQARYSEITNCTFQNVVMGAVQLPAVMDIFREAIAPRDVVLANNKFLNNYDDISVFSYGEDGPNGAKANTITNIEICNNYFYNGYGTPVNLRGTGSVKVHNNLFEYDKGRTNYLASIYYSDNIEIYDNVAYLSGLNIEWLYKEETSVVKSENNEKRS